MPGFIKQDAPPVIEPVASPTKGILMTPGTAAARRKTVTFGDHVVDNEEKRPIKSGLPDDCPGKFPSPWTKSDGEPEEKVVPAESGRGRSKLTESLERVRDESARAERESRKQKRIISLEEESHPAEYLDPKPDVAKYWKAMYEQYRSNSQWEMKKLITKQKAAKSFAMEKDFQCMELADDLQQEKKRADRLQKKVTELEAQLKALQQQLSDASLAPRSKSPAPARLVPNDNSEIRQRSPERRTIGEIDGPQTASLVTQPATAPKAEVLGAIDRTSATTGALQRRRLAVDSVKSRARAAPDRKQTQDADDIWNHVLDSSEPVLDRSSGKQPMSPGRGRMVTSGTNLTPLKSLSINTLAISAMVRRDSAQPSPPANLEDFAKEPLVRQEVSCSPKPDATREDSLLISPGLTQPTPEPAAGTTDVPTETTLVRNDATKDTSMPVPHSSPFQPIPVLSPSNVESKNSYFERSAHTSLEARSSPPAKENISLSSRPRAALSENIKPTAAWNAINAPNVGKRNTSLTDKSGKEVSQDRIEAARARMAARGRVMP